MTDVEHDLFQGFSSQRIKTSGAEINVRTGGDGPALLLIHGYPQTHAMWHRIAPDLVRRFTVVLPDLRGYGESSCPANDPDNFTYSKRAMAQDMVQVMEHAGHTVFAVVGHDRGGRVAYRMALDSPERVERLAVLDIVPTHAMWRNFTVSLAMKTYHWLFLAQPEPLPEMLIGKAPVEFQNYTLASWTGTQDLSAFTPAALKSYNAFFSRPGHIAATCHDYRAGQTYDLDADQADFDAGRKITCPLMAVWGKAGIAEEADGPLDIWRQWGDDIRGCGIDGGHFVAEENPGGLMKELLPFLLESETD